MNGEDNCYVGAKALHEAIGKPYGEFMHWYAEAVKPYVIESESFIQEVFTESGRRNLPDSDYPDLIVKPNAQPLASRAPVRLSAGQP